MVEMKEGRRRRGRMEEEGGRRAGVRENEGRKKKRGRKGGRWEAAFIYPFRFEIRYKKQQNAAKAFIYVTVIVFEIQ